DSPTYKYPPPQNSRNAPGTIPERSANASPRKGPEPDNRNVRESKNRNRKGPVPASGVFANVTDSDLKTTARLIAWQDDAAGAKRPVISRSERDTLNGVAAAERAIEVGDRPAALFASIVGKRQWHLITADQEAKQYASIMVPKISDSKLKDLTWSLDIKESMYTNKNQR
ncbi:MAG: hypothetical protein AAB917_02030, partial [Patescibacteria group bacterium]